MGSLKRFFIVYSSIAAMAVKARLAYSLWVWSDFVATIAVMVIYVFFWQAVYADRASMGGLVLNQTISYILLARILAPIVETRMIFGFGFMIREGRVASELVRPLDFQLRSLVEILAEMVTFLIQRIPVFLIAWLFLGLKLPRDPALWAAFFISLILGQLIIFLFDWIFACLAFYTTETWGLSVLRLSIGSFFSGALVPLVMMPDWLQKTASVMPFAQVIAVPVSFLSGILGWQDALRIWSIQLVWLAGLFIASRLVFNVAVRQVTVQGG
jgi:ABC-2 type transport system permease protein